MIESRRDRGSGFFNEFQGYFYGIQLWIVCRALEFPGHNIFKLEVVDNMIKIRARGYCDDLLISDGVSNADLDIDAHFFLHR